VGATHGARPRSWDYNRLPTNRERAMTSGVGSQPLERFLSRLHGVTRASHGFIARCPAHEDSNPSLSVKEGDDGRVLLKCHAGCRAEAIVSALGIELRDLFEADTAGRRREASKLRTKPPTEQLPAAVSEANGGEPTPTAEAGSDTRTSTEGLSLEQYADAKRLPIDFLRELGLSDTFVGQPWGCPGNC